MLARLTISLTMIDHIKHALAIGYLPRQWILQGTHSGLVREANYLCQMRGRLYTVDVVVSRIA